MNMKITFKTIHMQTKLIFTRKVLHLAVILKVRVSLEFRNGLLDKPIWHQFIN